MKQRLLNAALAILGLVVLGPFLIPVALAIILETRGSPLFLQRRIGRGEKPFTCWKLRTMTQGTPDVATHMVDAGRITRVGRILRRTRLDEVPQLWNVLIGDMNIVGPRPCLPSQKPLIEARRAEGVFAVRPGITGLAQVQGVDMTRPVRLARIDGHYVRNLSFRQDMIIVLATLKLCRIEPQPAPATPADADKPS